MSHISPYGNGPIGYSGLPSHTSTIGGVTTATYKALPTPSTPITTTTIADRHALYPAKPWEKPSEVTVKYKG